MKIWGVKFTPSTWGMLIGIAVGTMFCPVIGTVIGGFIGAFAGRGFAQWLKEKPKKK